MGFSCRIEKDSITQYGERLTTFVVSFPRFILAELNTHRMFSRSSASSRAVPFKTMVERAKTDPFIPIKWGKNQPGMQADEEVDDATKEYARSQWLVARDHAVAVATTIHEAGVHKQTVNRLLEPFLWHEVIISATTWSNFDHLRDNEKVQPEMEIIAGMMMEAYRASRPKLLTPGQWHLPFAQEGEILWDRPGEPGATLLDNVLVSVGRSARVSYLTHDGKRDPKADYELANTRLLGPGHMAPFEHAAKAMSLYEREIFEKMQWSRSYAPERFDSGPSSDSGWVSTENAHYCGNFDGFVQARKLIPFEHDPLSVAR